MNSAHASSAPTAGPTSRKPRRRWRLGRTVLLVSVLLVAGTYTWRDALIGPLIIREIQRVAADEFGLQVGIGATGGDYLSTFELKDVSVGAAPEFGLERATIGWVTVQYSLLGLLHGSPDAIHRAHITGLDATLDVDGIEVDELDTGWPDLDQLPEVVLDDARLDLRSSLDGKPHSFEVVGLSLHLPAGALGQATQEVVNVAAQGSTLSGPALGVLASAGATGSTVDAPVVALPGWHAVLQRRGDQLELRDLVSAGTTWLDRAALDLDAAMDGRIQLEAEAPLAAGRARVTYATGDEHDRCTLDLRAAELPALRKLAETVGLPLDVLPASGVAEVAATLDLAWQPEFQATGTVALEAHDLGWAADAADDTSGGRRLIEVLPWALRRVTLEAALEADVLTLDRCEVEGSGLRADLAGTRLLWQPVPTLDLAVTGELVGDEFPAGAPLSVESRVFLDEDGSLQIPTLRATGPGARLELAGLTVVPGAIAARLDLEHAHVVVDVEDSTADLHDLALDWDVATERLTASVRDAQVSARGQQVALTAPARLSWSQAGLLQVDSMEWAGAGGELSLGGHVDVLREQAELQLVARNLQPTGLLRAFMPQLPGFELLELLEVDVRGPPAALTSTLTLRVLGVSGVAARPLDVDLQARHQPTSLDIDRLEVSVASHVLATGTAHMALLDGRPDARAGDLAADFSFALEGAPDVLGELPFRTTRLGGELTASGAWPRPEVTVTLHGDALEIPDAELPQAARWPDLRAEVRLADGVLALTDLSVDAGVFQLNASGRCEDLLQLGWDADGLPTLALDRNAPLEGRLDVSGEESVMLLAALAGIRRAAGSVDAALTIDGTISNPHVQGPVTFTGGEIAAATGGIASITGLEGSAVFDAPLSLSSDTPLPGIVVRDVQVVGELGASPFSVSGGMTWTPPGPDSPTAELLVDLLLDGKELLLYRAGGVKVRADAHLRLHGPWQAMAVTGQVGITDGRMTRHLSILDLGGAEAPISMRLDRIAITQAPWNAVSLDVAVTTLEPMRVSNRLIRANVRLESRLVGKGANPQMTGNLYVERAQIELPLWTFQADRIGVAFDQRSLLRSVLSGTARSRMVGYDVLAVFSGPLEEPEVRLTSLPPLPEEDLLNLVLTGQLPQEGAFAEDSRVLTGVAIYLGKDLLSRALGDESTESSESFLNRFEMETGRNQSRTGSETLDVRFRMLDNLLTNDDSVYIEVEQSEFDETNGSLRFVFRLK